MPTRVFVVEDEPVVASGIARKLEHLGYEVPGTAASGEAAIRGVERYRPDIVLMDIKLSGNIDGIEAARAIREQHSIPVVYLTSYSDEATMTRALREAPYGYLVKPFSERELAGALEVALLRSEIHERTRTSEEHYRMVSNAVSDYAYCLRLADDPAADELLWSDGDAARALGSEVESFRTIVDAMHLVHPDDVEAVGSFSAACRDEDGLSVEFRVTLPDGETRWIKADTRRVRESGRGQVVVYGSYQHVSPLRISSGNRNGATAEGGFSLGEVLHTVNQGVWVGDADRVCTYANDALCRLSGYTHDTLVGRPSLEMLLGEERAEDDSDAVFEADVRCADGSTVAAVVTTRAIVRGGEPSGFFYLFVDVSRQRHALELVDRGRRKLQGAFHASPIPSLVVDSATNAILDANDAFCEETGYTTDDLVGRGVFGLAEYEKLDDLNQMLVLLQEESGRRTTLRLRTRAGEIHPYSVVARTIEVDGEAVRVLVLSEPDPLDTE